MVTLLLAMAFFAAGDEKHDLRTLITSPVDETGEVWLFDEDHLRIKHVPLPSGETREERVHTQKVFTQEVMRVGEDGFANMVLRHYRKAVIEADGKTIKMEHHGKYALMEAFKPEVWQPTVYHLVDGNRVDIAANPNPLRKDGLLINATRRAHQLLFEHLPKQPLAIGESWPVSVGYFADALEKLVGLEEKASELRLTLVAVKSHQVQLAITGRVIFDAQDSKKMGNMQWEGHIRGKLILDHGPYRERLRNLTVDEEVTLTLEDQSVSGKGKLVLSRKVDPDHQHQ